MLLEEPIKHDVFITSQQDLDDLASFLHSSSSSLEELANLFHSQTHYEVIDVRDSTETTGVNAQRDTEFYAEAETLSELCERKLTEEGLNQSSLLSQEDYLKFFKLTNLCNPSNS